MNSLEFMVGIILGIALGYVLAKFMQKRKRLTTSLFATKNTSSSKMEKLPKEEENSVKRGEVSLDKNLNTEETKPDLELVLQLLNEYQINSTSELLETLQHELEIHEGHNVLHEYLGQEHVELEKVEEMVEINHELLTEENGEGETALHVAENHEHYEVAEWMVEHAHFGSEHERHHFLEHHNHHGHTALHDAAHLWHYHPPHRDHFLHMLEKHPIGALMWKDGEGKTVYEHYFEHPGADRHRLLEALEHKGVIHKHGDHFELSEQAEEHLREAHHSHDTPQLRELLVKEYSPTQATTPDAAKNEQNTPAAKEEVKHQAHQHNTHHPS
jgi:hypothetical protein